MMAVLLNRWFILAVLLLAGTGAIFGRDVFEQSTDAARGLLGGSDDRSSGLSPDLFRAKVRSGLSRNDTAQLSVSEVKLESRATGRVVMSARLASSVSGNDYPNLVVELKAASGEVIRSIELLPSQYEHAAGLTDEHIRFNVELRAGESRVAAHLVYPTAPPSEMPAAPA